MGRGVPLPKNGSEFCDPKYWDAFFKARGGRPFEWYGEWNLIGKLVVEKCGLKTYSNEKILIPGCGNSTLSADMYDGGFTQITNIDFSRVVISEMLRQHVRSRPHMRWLVMDMTKMQFSDESFDVAVDKSGLDALLGEPDDDHSFGDLFLSEVKRVLKPGGKFACVTLAQQHVIELLLRTFREGWHLSVHALQLPAADVSSTLQPFIVIAMQDNTALWPLVTFDMGVDWHGSANSFQMQATVEALDAENNLRSKGAGDYGSTKIPQMQTQDLFEDLHPGRRSTLKLGGEQSQYSYTGVILDANDMEQNFRCAVFLVPTGRDHEWLFSSAEGQWRVAESSRAGRLIMILLDSNQTANIMDLKDEISTLVTPLLPLDCRDSNNVPFVTQGDKISTMEVVAEVQSAMTGAMVVLEDERTSDSPGDEAMLNFRLLMFRRNPNLIQSEALLIPKAQGSNSQDKGLGPEESSRKQSSGKKKKKSTKESKSPVTSAATAITEVDHSYLASQYQAGIVAAFVLITRNLEYWSRCKEQVKLVLVGLGAGTIPMFVHNHLPVGDIKVVELDPVVGDVAKRYFGFTENNKMKLQIEDGIVAVKRIASTAPTSNVQSQAQAQSAQSETHSGLCRSENGTLDSREITGDGGANKSGEGEGSMNAANQFGENLMNMEVNDDDSNTTSRTRCQPDSRVHILIVDADSGDISSGLSCPPQEFLEDPFLQAAKRALFDGGMLVMNIAARASSHYLHAVTQLKTLFEEVYVIEVHEDVNRVLIALPRARSSDNSHDITQDLSIFEKLTRAVGPWNNGPDLRTILMDLRRLK